MKYNKTITVIQITALLIGVALTINGLYKLSWPDAIPWNAGGKERFGLFLMIAFAFVSLLVWRYRWNAFVAAALGAVILAGVGGALGAFLVAFWMIAASTILGRWLLNKIDVEVNNWMTPMLVGAGVYGTAVGLLAHFPVNYSGIYAAALALPLVLGRKTLQQWLGILRQRAVTPYRRLDEHTSIWLEIAIAVLLLTHFIVALMPEVGHDALVTHLFVPVHLATRHQWSFDATTYIWAVLPMLGDWIFSIAYMLGGETATRIINVGFVFVLGWLVRDLVLWAGGRVRGARWAALIFLSTPLIFTESSSLFIESIWASFVVAGALALFRASSDNEHTKNQLVIAGVLLGCSLATKAVTFTVLPPLLLILALRYKAWLKPGIARTLIVGLVLFLILGVIPYATAWSLTGNPVFPFFNKLFQSPLWRAENFEASVFGKGVTWDILYRATFQSEKYLEGFAGSAGFQWLLLFFPASIVIFLSGRWRGLSLIVFGVLSIVLTFHSTAYLRYIAPSYAVLAAAIGLCMSANDVAGSIRSWLWSCVAIFAVLLNILFMNAGAFYGDFALKSILSPSDREQYLLGRLPLRNAVSLVNSLNIGGTPVAVLGQPMTAGLVSDALYSSWYNNKFEAAMDSIHSEQGMVDMLLDKRVDFVILDSGWIGTKEQHDLVTSVTDQLATFGPITVRKIKGKYLLKKEMLVNPSFDTTTSWSLIGDAKLDSKDGAVLVSVASPAVQVVRISPGRRYLNAVIARCYKEASKGRVQVNWNNAEGEFIAASIQTFDCSADWTQHEAEIVAPKNAATAAVYATGHSQTPIEFKEVSFRQ
jgi:4-amino-4-deoxy-L-arabinose transferase-like glycosyltransferase